MACNGSATNLYVKRVWIVYTERMVSVIGRLRPSSRSAGAAGEAIGEDPAPFLHGGIQLVEIARRVPADPRAKHAAAEIRGPGGEILPARGFEARHRAWHVEGRGDEDPGRVAAVRVHGPVRALRREERPGEAGVLGGVARLVLDHDPLRGDAARRENGLGQGFRGGTCADEARRCAGEDEPRLGEAMRERNAGEETLARLVQRDLARGGPAIGLLAPAEHDDAGDGLELRGRGMAGFQGGDQQKAQREDPDCEEREEAGGEDHLCGAQASGPEREDPDQEKPRQPAFRADQQPDQLRGEEEQAVQGASASDGTGMDADAGGVLGAADEFDAGGFEGGF